MHEQKKTRGTSNVYQLAATSRTCSTKSRRFSHSTIWWALRQRKQRHCGERRSTPPLSPAIALAMVGARARTSPSRKATSSCSRCTSAFASSSTVDHGKYCAVSRLPMPPLLLPTLRFVFRQMGEANGLVKSMAAAVGFTFNLCNAANRWTLYN